MRWKGGEDEETDCCSSGIKICVALKRRRRFQKLAIWDDILRQYVAMEARDFKGKHCIGYWIRICRVDALQWGRRR